MSMAGPGEAKIRQRGFSLMQLQEITGKNLEQKAITWRYAGLIPELKNTPRITIT